MEFNRLDDHIKRRVAFLRNEAFLKSPRDQIVTYCMRVVSNYATIGRDGGSTLIKRLNRNLSKKALLLLKSTNSINEWAGFCINEHKIPLQKTWSWLSETAVDLTDETIWNHFRDNPMVTILKTEDSTLSNIGLRSSVTDLDRYSLAGIEVVILPTSPEEAVHKRYLKSVYQEMSN
jgi:hypothetical protein